MHNTIHAKMPLTSLLTDLRYVPYLLKSLVTFLKIFTEIFVKFYDSEYRRTEHDQTCEPHVAYTNFYAYS